MKTLVKLIAFVMCLPLFVACNNEFENENEYDDLQVDIATVENPNNLSSFFFRLDDDQLLWTAESNFRDYRPLDGQRIIAYYTKLYDKQATGLYDYDVKLVDVYPVLTKGIFHITPATQDSIGNDSISIRDMWIGSDYLNVQFVYPGNDRIHFINLVSDTSKVYTDGKIHLEFRHNANGDLPYYYKEGIVSINLSELKSQATGTTADLVIHVNIPNQAVDKLYNLTYDFGEAPTFYRSPKISLPKRNIINEK